MGYPRAVAPGVDRLPCARVSGCTECLGAALHPRLGKRAGLFGQHVGSEKVCQHPPGALGSYKILAGCSRVRGPRGSSGLAAPGRSAQAGKRDHKHWDAGSPPARAIPGRGARPLSSQRPGPVAASRDLSTTTSQLRFHPARAGEDRTLPGGRRDVASALSDGDADKLRLGMLL